ncbi:hypothetical protein LCGC14_1078500 [marine sediment metagenome]|uniref:Uncharacterized protein n=1 Tax=marine sediment metagenome TaxID=412755 RepID=A0A0F9QLU9_9ZZZZ
MASGETTTGSLSDALPSIVADTRIKMEYEGSWRRTCDIKKQEEGTGLSWTEFTLDKLSRQAITETADNRNFQQLSGSLQAIEPTMNQILIKITDRTYRKLSKNVSSDFGPLSANAMNRGDDEDYLATFSTFATTNSPGAGNPMSFGYIASAVTNIQGNTTEPNDTEVYSVLHPFQKKDIQDEVLAGVGTYTVPVGLTADTFRKGFSGTVAESNLFTDGNITIDSSSDANGATHSRMGVIAAIGMDIKHETDRDIYFGGGADVISLTNELAFAERKSSGTQVWAYRHLSDCTAPTS